MVEIFKRGLPGVHHVTALVSDMRSSLDFYSQVLGLRLVKKTVSFDDPASCHLYLGNRSGEPGTLVTLVPSEEGARFRTDRGAISFSVPQSSLEYWLNRFRKLRIPFEGLQDRFQDTCLPFTDPDGLPLELVSGPEPDARAPWREGPVPPDKAVRGIYSVSLPSTEAETTATLLGQALGLMVRERAADRIRLGAGSAGPGCLVDLMPLPDGRRRSAVAGQVEHLAWRAGTARQQDMWRRRLLEAGIAATPAVDRRYFRSVYFREPGGILFELATDGPGLSLDESVQDLGKGLQLPPWLEKYRSRIEGLFPELAPTGEIR
jgi:glyoxalase family protein